MSIDRRLLRKLAGAAGAAVGLGVAVAAGIGAANAGPTAAPGLPPAKSARLQQEQKQVRHLPASSKTAPAGPAAAAATTTSAFAGLTPGVVDLHQGPFPAALFTVGNMYRLPVGDHWDFAFAGSDPTRGDRSAVRVYRMTADGTYTEAGEYLSPIQAGTLSITGGSGTTLTLKAGARTEKFDVATLTFG